MRDDEPLDFQSIDTRPGREISMPPVKPPRTPLEEMVVRVDCSADVAPEIKCLALVSAALNHTFRDPEIEAGTVRSITKPERRRILDALAKRDNLAVQPMSIASAITDAIGIDRLSDSK